MVKLVCIDLDGTLLNDKKQISDQDKQVISLARQAAHITIFTGRSYFSALPYLEELGIDIPVVFQNGALIATPFERRVIHQISLNTKVALEALKHARRRGIYTVVYESFFSPQDMLVEKEYRGAFEYYFSYNTHRVRTVSDLAQAVRDRDSIAEIALIGKSRAVETLVQDLEMCCPKAFTAVKNQKKDETVFTEIFGPNTGKEKALDVMLNIYGIDPLQVMFIGDNYNDSEIMRKVGYSVAMDNAPEDIKKIARFTTASNNDSGVSLAIKKFVLGGDI